MRRRAFLATGLAAVTAGCVSGGDDELGVSTLGAIPDASTTEAGLAPDRVDESPDDVDLDSMERFTQHDVEIPLVPIEVAYDWYRTGSARFVDARSEAAFEAERVTGAVVSPARDGLEENDLTETWDPTERSVTYCGCPHSLSTSRAAGMVMEGHEAVFAIDEGFNPWIEQYPTSTGDADSQRSAPMTVVGQVDAAYAGEEVWVRHDATDQRYPGQVGADGSFEVTFAFYDVETDDQLTVDTPEWTRTGTVAEQTDSTPR